MLLEAGREIRSHIIRSLSQQSVHQLSRIHSQKKEDTIFEIDRQIEPVLLNIFQKYAHRAGGMVLIAEGISTDENPLVIPHDLPEQKAALRIIIDPIDGTRGLMYNKRPAFFLAGAAPNKGSITSLQDIEVAVMTELPVSKQYLADTLWGIKGQGIQAMRENLLTREQMPLSVSPSSAATIEGGFAQFARFFPPGRHILALVEEELIKLLATNAPDKALVFEDQYISSGGQLYELLMGHDRFTADIRALLYQKLENEGKPRGHVCHPYDVCAHIIGMEAGLVITDAQGEMLNAPLNLSYQINWIGYANTRLFHAIQPVLNFLLKKHQFI
ncbi:MAG: hypothetical protein KatS3mg032_2435 [Cyclobacteriaceae bacterium]|nr:MAG: hypothetical protein KatS3mg032_2435 [Cyclobacteriaceae bacterium]